MHAQLEDNKSIPLRGAFYYWKRYAKKTISGGKHLSSKKFNNKKAESLMIPLSIGTIVK